MKQNVYKVVKVFEGEYVSPFTFGGYEKYILKYSLNKWTFPHAGRIFVYQTPEKLVKHNNHRIMTCEFNGRLEPIHWVAAEQWLFEDFWKWRGLMNDDSLVAATPGSCIVDALYPIGFYEETQRI